MTALSKDEFAFIIVHTAFFMNFLWQKDLISFLLWIGCLIVFGCGAIAGIKSDMKGGDGHAHGSMCRV